MAEMTPFSGILPTSVDLRPLINEVEDQGQLGSCTSFASTKGLEIIYERAGIDVAFSQLYQYYWTRKMGGAVGQEGGNPAFMIQTLKDRGCCLEASWPYIVANENVQPPANCDTEAAPYRILSYEASPTPDSNFARGLWVKNCLANGTPVMMSFFVSQNFETQAGACKDWRKTQWSDFQSPSLGGHEVCIIGYDDAAGHFLIQNSWGPNWGDGGFFGMNYSYFESGSQTVYAITQAAIPLTPVTGNAPVVIPPTPTRDSSCADVVQYIFASKFGRNAKPAGMDFWAQGTLDYMLQQIVAAASPADKQYMKDHNITA